MRLATPLAAAALALVATAHVAHAAAVEWDAFVIRNASPSSTPVAPVENATGDGLTVTIDEANEKAGYGTSFFDGKSVSTLGSVSYTRVDSGPKTPFLNVWVTDGTKYAVIAPVNGVTTTGAVTGSVDVNGVDLQSLGFNIYEFSDTNFDWLVPGAKRVQQALLRSDDSVITLADIGGLTVMDPGSPYPVGVGSGAPKNGTGFNLIFGDTQGNFASPTPFVIADAAVTAVPTPSAALGVVWLAGLVGLRRTRA